MVWSLTRPSLPYVKFKVIIFEENIRHSTMIASGFLHDPLTNGSAPGPRWGLRPQTPLLARAPCARHACPPHIFLTWRRP